MRPPQRYLILALPLFLLLAVVAAALFQAQRALRGARAQTAATHHLHVSLRTLDPAALRNQNPGFEPVAAAVAFTSGVFLHDQLYLTSPSGLSVYAADGTLRRTLRIGLDLPAATPVRAVAGRLRGAADQQLLLATSGAGVLILTPGPGPSITQLLPEDENARDVTTLLPTASGDLLLGTRHRGLLAYNGSTLEPVPLAVVGLDCSKLEITALAGDASAFFIGTRNAGVLFVHAGAVDRIDSAAGLPDDEVDAIALAGGKAYIGTPVGVAELDPASTHAVRVIAPGVFAHALAVDAAGTTLTVGTIDQGVQQIALGPRARMRPASISVEAEPGSQRVEQLLTAPGGLLYALSGANVVRVGGSAWTPVLTAAASTLTDADISALAFAPDGRLWVGFFDRGLDVLNPDLTRAQHLEDDRLFCINRLVLDPARHSMAAATANGLVLFDAQGHPRQTLTRRDGLISDHVNDLVFTPSGTALATPAGITFLSADGASSLYAFQGLVNNHVYALALSPDAKQLLAGTLGGLSLLESQSVRRNLTATNSALKHNWITAIVSMPAEAGAVKDGAGKAGWLIGTYGAGVERLAADGTFTPIELPTSAPRDLVINPNALLATQTAIYAGTLGRGLLIYQRATQRWSILTRGLPSLNVTAFAQRQGELFIGTGNGLVRIPESTLAQFLNGEAQ